MNARVMLMFSRRPCIKIACRTVAQYGKLIMAANPELMRVMLTQVKQSRYYDGLSAAVKDNVAEYLIFRLLLHGLKPCD
jgi:hypothetical protein